MGFPELCLSEDHADVRISYVGATMKKLKKNDPYRDTVPSHFRRLKSFCDVMAANIASHDANETSASLLTEELFFPLIFCFRHSLVLLIILSLQ